MKKPQPDKEEFSCCFSCCFFLVIFVCVCVICFFFSWLFFFVFFVLFLFFFNFLFIFFLYFYLFVIFQYLHCLGSLKVSGHIGCVGCGHCRDPVGSRYPQRDCVCKKQNKEIFGLLYCICRISTIDYVATDRDRAFSSQFGRGRITVRFKKVALGNWGDYKRKKHIHIADAFPNIRSLQQIALPFKKFLFVVFWLPYIYTHLLFICGQNGRRNLIANSTPRRPNKLPSRIQESRTGYTPQVLSPTYVVDGPRVEHLKGCQTLNPPMRRQNGIMPCQSLKMFACDARPCIAEVFAKEIICLVGHTPREHGPVQASRPSDANKRQLPHQIVHEDHSQLTLADLHSSTPPAPATMRRCTPGPPVRLAG